jgi:hypothetical protein
MQAKSLPAGCDQQGRYVTRRATNDADEVPLTAGDFLMAAFMVLAIISPVIYQFWR